MIGKRQFEGAEREAMHENMLRYMDIGHEFGPEHNTTDKMAADLARKDPTLLTDILGEKYGPRLSLPEGNTSEEIARGTSGTWCMFAAERHYFRVLEVAHGAGIDMDDPLVFLKGGLLTNRRWLLVPELVTFALKLGASPNGNIQKNEMFPSFCRSSPIEMLTEIIRNEAPHIYVCKMALESVKSLISGKAIVSNVEDLLEMVENKFGLNERSLVLASVMQANIARARESEGLSLECTQPTAPKRARVRV